jgi:hypothetical protein
MSRGGADNTMKHQDGLMWLTIWQDLQAYSGLRKWGKRKQRSYYCVFIVNELYKTVNKTEDVTPGRVRNHNES